MRIDPHHRAVGIAIGKLIRGIYHDGHFSDEDINGDIEALEISANIENLGGAPLQKRIGEDGHDWETTILSWLEVLIEDHQPFDHDRPGGEE